MQRMWRWVLIYALIGGAIMALPTMGVLIIGVLCSAGGGASLIISAIVSLLTCLGTIGGFSVLMASAIFFRSDDKMGRLLSLIGIGLYIVAALVIVPIASIYLVAESSQLIYLFVAALTVLFVITPGVLIALKLRRLPETEKTKT
jgi:MFS family permease